MSGVIKRRNTICRCRLVFQYILLFAQIVLVPSTWAATYKGQVYYRNVVELRAGVSGVVETVTKVAGARFNQGELLVRLDQRPFASTLKTAELRNTLAVSEYEEAENSFGRDEELFDEGSMSLVEIDSAKLALHRIRVEMLAARDTLDQARYHMDLSNLAAPFNGMVLDVHRTRGEFVNAVSSAPALMTIAETGKFTLRISLAADDLKGTGLGMKASILQDGGKIPARVGALTFQKGDSEPIYIVDIYFDYDGNDVIAGQSLEVDIP